MSFDYQGLATLIAAIAAAIVSILGAVQSYKNSRQIRQVEQATNGLMHTAMQQAHKVGRLEGFTEASGLTPPPARPPHADLGPIDSGPPL